MSQSIRTDRSLVERVERELEYNNCTLLRAYLPDLIIELGNGAKYNEPCNPIHMLGIMGSLERIRMHCNFEVRFEDFRFETFTLLSGDTIPVVVLDNFFREVIDN